MAKPKFSWKMVSYGIHSRWDRASRDLPKLVKFTTVVPARLDIEFGYVLNIKKAKGVKLSTCIEHPPFKDAKGRVRPAFVGDVYVRSNDWNFYLGDTIWEPIWDKIGEWRMITSIDDMVLADKTFEIVEEGSAELAGED